MSGDKIGLSDVLKHVRATVLIGLSTLPLAFTEPIVREMASKVERPIIFPLSNPTDRSEARPEDLLRWTEGRALVATGSPYAPVRFGERTIPISQCNNVYIFPAVGLAVIASRPFAYPCLPVVPVLPYLSSRIRIVGEIRGGRCPNSSEIKLRRRDQPVRSGGQRPCLFRATRPELIRSCHNLLIFPCFALTPSSFD